MSRNKEVVKSSFQYLTIPSFLMIIGTTAIVLLSLYYVKNYEHFFLSKDPTTFWLGYLVIVGLIFGCALFLVGFMLFSKFFFTIKQKYPPVVIDKKPAAINTAKLKK